MTILPRHISEGCGCDDPVVSSGLISVDNALSRIQSHIEPIISMETLPLHAASGRVLAAPVHAQSDMPRFDHAAMDGYAIDSDALKGDGPWVLPVTGRVAAGDDIDRLRTKAGACRIFTGAQVPHGFDSVVMQEKVERLGNMVKLTKRPKRHNNVRLKGEEHACGAVIVSQGTKLTPSAIAACAAAGHGQVSVRKQVRVTLLASGSEITNAGQGDLSSGQIWDVNTPMLQALLSREDVLLQSVVRVDDSVSAIRSALEIASRTSDLIVTTGGVSVGEEDHLPAAVSYAGGRILFSGVAIKPGKPVTLGQIGDAVWLGLPGNPGSAFVTWSVFGDMVLHRLSGRSSQGNLRRHVVLGNKLSRKPGRCEVRACTVTGLDSQGRDIVTCLNNANSGQVTSFVQCDGLAFLPSEIEYLPEGALVEFLPLCKT